MRATAPAPNSVAVLYFDNLSRDTADAYLADGLTEEITSRLGGVQRLQIKRPSRDAVRRLRDTVPDYLVTVGRVLRVRYLVEGSVRRADARMRVSVGLVKAADGFRVWSEAYDRAPTDLLALQEEIAREVATGIAGRLGPAERAALAARPTRNPEAYERFLRGNYYLAQRTPRSVTRAIEEYSAALRLDPEFAPALARIAFGYELFAWYAWDYGGVSPESLLARGFAAVDRALQRNPNSSDAWMARAMLLTSRNPRTLEGVSPAFERAIALDPRNAEAQHLYGHHLRELGEDAAAAAAYHRALAIEPERTVSLYALGWLYYQRRRYDEARRWLDSALALDRAFFWPSAMRARVRLQLGQTAEALSDAETAVRLSAGDGYAEAVLALAELHAGDTVAARVRMERVLRELPHPHRPAPLEALLGAALAALGQHERALDFLERVQPRGVLRWDVLKAPEFDSIRSHPRFQRLVGESRP
ncbi:MAG: tetratricopeptide repeat protein [Gemmatimonadales bacterium]